MTAKKLINKLNLQPHPEGGYYKETYRSDQFVNNNEGKKRNINTAIFYLLENKDRSLFHRIKSDELWLFHQGEAIEIVSILDDELVTTILGNDVTNGQTPQTMIPANTWFAAKIKNGSGYSLVSCSVSPGFDFSDFELAKRQQLIDEYSHLKNVIEEFTK